MTINLEQSIDVRAPVEDVYNVWSQFSNFSDFMGGALQTEITHQEENQSISWQTLKGVKSNATVRFTPIDDGHTNVTVSVRYPNGVGLQNTVQDVTREIEADLKRFVKLLQGQPSAGQQNIGADVLGPAYAMSQPKSPLALSQDFAQTLEKNLDSAASAWIKSLMSAFVAPLNQMRRMLVAQHPGNWAPDIDVSRDGQAVQVSVLLPGATEDDIEVEIRDGRLLISGECNFSEDGHSSSHFQESINLLNKVDSRTVEARIDGQGLLVISLNLHEEEADAVA